MEIDEQNAFHISKIDALNYTLEAKWGALYNTLLTAGKTSFLKHMNRGKFEEHRGDIVFGITDIIKGFRVDAGAYSRRAMFATGAFATSGLER